MRKVDILAAICTVDLAGSFVLSVLGAADAACIGETASTVLFGVLAAATIFALFRITPCIYYGTK